MKSVAALLFMNLLFLSPGCSSSSSRPIPGFGREAGSPATFTEVYANVIALRCAPCHTTPAGQGIVVGKLDMTSQSVAYANLVGSPAAGSACAGKGTRVVPGKPDSSVMYLKVSLDDPTPCGQKMPLGGPPLSQSEADTIESWITAGAPND